jgi:hypothetical protein
MKKISRWGLVAGLVCSGFLAAEEWHDFAFVEDELDQFVATADLSHGARDPAVVDAQFVLNIVAAPPILLQNRLRQDFYKFTNPINVRSLLDLPWALLSQTTYDSCWHWNFWLFYNQDSEDNYTSLGRNISSYLNLEDSQLIDGIEQIGLNINLENVFDLIGVMRIQERRVGLMVDVSRGFGCWFLEWKTPIYYLERNFYLTPQEKKQIEDELLLNDSQQNSNKEFEKHVVSDQVGLGDSRFSAGYRLVDREGVIIDVGPEITIPTALAFSKGLIGSNFPKNDLAPYLDILELFRLVICFNETAQAIEQLRLFGEAAFDKLSANLLQTGLGNNGHFGIALFTYNSMPLSERFWIENRFAVEYLLPKRERRFFILRKNPETFDAYAPYTTEQGADPAQAPAKLAFLNQQLIETFIPRVFVTTIFPGFLVKFSSMVMGDFGCNWNFGIGYDLWWQTREKFGRISTDRFTRAMLEKGIAHRHTAFQNKVFGMITYSRPARCYDWCVTLYGDYTFLATGIGQDVEAVIKMSFYF